ncbi:MAG: hypothetical protein HY297_01960 [Thaumarchaeota archaeon]|nr:hypothetical protein [Nitrososphaerota archaeon]
MRRTERKTLRLVAGSLTLFFIVLSTVFAALALATVAIKPQNIQSCAGNSECLARALSEWASYGQSEALRGLYTNASVLSIFCLFVALVVTVGPRWQVSFVVLGLVAALLAAYEFAIGREIVFRPSWFERTGLEIVEALLVSGAVLALWRLSGKFRDPSLSVPGWIARASLTIGLGSLGLWFLYSMVMLVIPFAVRDVAYAWSPSLLDWANVFNVFYYGDRYGLGFGSVSAAFFVVGFLGVVVAGLHSLPVMAAARRGVIVCSFLSFVFFLSILAFDTKEINLQIINPLRPYVLAGVPVVNNVLGLSVSGLVILLGRTKRNHKRR